MWPTLSDIMTDPSADTPQKRFNALSAPYKNTQTQFQNLIEQHDEIEKLHCATYEGGEDSAVFVIVDDEGETAFELFEDLMRRHGAAVAESPVRLDHEQRLVSALGQPILLVKEAQVLQIPHENAVHVIHPREQTATTNNHIANQQPLIPIARLRFSLPSVGGDLR